MSAPIQADSDGIINGLLTIPGDKIPTGTKLIEFYGGANPLPSYAAAQFVSRGTINLVERQSVRRRKWRITTLEFEDTRPPTDDPLAQSFMVPTACQLSFVDLWFDGQKGPSDVILQFREVINGYPGPRVLGESIMTPEQITLSGVVGVRGATLSAFGSGGTDGVYSLGITGGGGSGASGEYTVIDGSVAWIDIKTPGSGYTSAPTLSFPGSGVTGAAATAQIGDYNRFEFDPTVFYPDQMYCIVAICNDAVWRLRVAILGDVDGPTQQRIAAQPYIVGVLFSSSNNVTWTAHQDRDLRFRMGGPAYTVTEKTIRISPDGFSVTDCDYLGLLGAIELPSNETAVRFTATLPLEGNPKLNLRLNDFTLLPQRITGAVVIEATLYGTADLTPLVYPDFEILAGTTDAESLYVTRSIDIQASPNTYPTKVSILFDYRSPVGSTIAAHVWDAAANAWVEVPADTTAYVLPMTNGWTESVLVIDDFDTDNRSTKIRLTLTGTAWARPEIRRLRAVFNDNP